MLVKPYSDHQCDIKILKIGSFNFNLQTIENYIINGLRYMKKIELFFHITILILLFEKKLYEET